MDISQLPLKSVGDVNSVGPLCLCLGAFTRVQRCDTRGFSPSGSLRRLRADLPFFGFGIPEHSPCVVHLHFEKEGLFFTSRGFSFPFFFPGPRLDVLKLLGNMCVLAFPRMTTHVFQAWKSSTLRSVGQVNSCRPACICHAHSAM